jgi:hypothetical protein
MKRIICGKSSVDRRGDLGNRKRNGSCLCRKRRKRRRCRETREGGRGVDQTGRKGSWYGLFVRTNVTVENEVEAMASRTVEYFGASFITRAALSVNGGIVA